jgi:hypothetical protein
MGYVGEVAEITIERYLAYYGYDLEPAKRIDSG